MYNGEIDLDVGTRSNLPQELSQIVLLHEYVRITRLKGHPRGYKRFTIKSYCTAEHIMVLLIGSFRSSIDDELDEPGRHRYVAL
jgi:hypothetical protein